MSECGRQVLQYDSEHLFGPHTAGAGSLHAAQQILNKYLRSKSKPCRTGHLSSGLCMQKQVVLTFNRGYSIVLQGRLKRDRLQHKAFRHNTVVSTGS